MTMFHLVGQLSESSHSNLWRTLAEYSNQQVMHNPAAVTGVLFRFFGYYPLLITAVMDVLFCQPLSLSSQFLHYL